MVLRETVYIDTGAYLDVVFENSCDEILLLTDVAVRKQQERNAFCSSLLRDQNEYNKECYTNKARMVKQKCTIHTHTPTRNPSLTQRRRGESGTRICSRIIKSVVFHEHNNVHKQKRSDNVRPERRRYLYKDRRHCTNRNKCLLETVGARRNK